MKTILTLFFCSVVLCQGEISPETSAPQSVTEAASVSLPIPEPSTVLLSIMAGALGILRRKRS